MIFPPDDIPEEPEYDGDAVDDEPLPLPQPDDISGTLESRSVTISRESLQPGFAAKPVETLSRLAAEYHNRVKIVDAGLAAAHHDWAVRVALDHTASMPVTEAGVHQNGKWVEFRGAVGRIHRQVPEGIWLSWTCNECEDTIRLAPDAKPGACVHCKSRLFTLDKAGSEFIDTQRILLVENFEEVKGSKPPRMLDCKLTGTLVHTLSPGDRCIVGGVMNLRPVKGGYEYELLVNNIEQFNPKKDVKPPVIEGDVMARLVESFAPQVHGHHMIKESIILMMVGGSDAVSRRTNSHILLVGDPGIAKSMLLKEAAAIAPLGRYTSGRGSTAAGLTAGMQRDREGVMYLEAGAAVLTDGGQLCLDEFDKMQSTDWDSLHEVLEQQSVSTTKIGVLVTMHARVAVLAAANPKGGSWDDEKVLIENINLPETLLTRFDLIFQMVDQRDPDVDRRIARRIIHRKTDNVLGKDEITAYIESVRRLSPTLTEDAAKALEDYYVSARSVQGEIRITARQLEAAMRLAGARAKLYRRNNVLLEDVTRATELVETVIQRTMVDPDTGKPDLMRATGEKPRKLIHRVREAVGKMEGEFSAADIVDMVKADFSEVEETLVKLHSTGILLEGTPGVYRRA